MRPYLPRWPKMDRNAIVQELGGPAAGLRRNGAGLLDQTLLVDQPAAGEPLDLLLTRTDGAGVLSPDVAPRTAVLRLR